MHHRRVWAGVVAAGMVTLLCACTASTPRPSASTSTPARPTPAATAPAADATPVPVRPLGEPVVIAEGLDAPWSILRLPSGATLISERDTALLRELLPDGGLRDAGTVAGVEPVGEGGLLGLAFLAAGDGAADPTTPDAGWVYAYFTAASDNRIVRMPLTGTAGGLGLGEPESVLSGIPAASNHNGGRIGFGPDGLLYATVGDAGESGNAQDLGSLGGKILRMTPTGQAPADNPFGSLVYSYGHRNPQGLAWDSSGQLWASEFGQNTWDELNLITAGGNYGWPEAEGAGGGGAFIDPVQQWSTDEASPSGLAVVNDTLFLAALRGERLWRVDPSTGTVDGWFVNSFGRLRDVVSGPDGTLWFVSNNTDGRGAPSPGDDRLYQVQVGP
ncbi:glucose dehydrogenase [Cryobacterium sp. LW097]|uniref:PQQ-dependent sugar dehydrogenase n=1 Tax=unclassified Cryobacterium TaxID=2649013 RepID=UPI000B4CA1EE|nr:MULTISPECIES: PQQ-dependent sugar dehydrogenase [unclassified Cryobacterium]ASD23199.1 glucose dehydrogenase [Cryobacterium sp. LW097]TFC91440.1 PQQ-dependent sugar dehydrogenase [Cryobacterium sp. TMT4-31]